MPMMTDADDGAVPAAGAADGASGTRCTLAELVLEPATANAARTTTATDNGRHEALFPPGIAAVLHGR